jgi:glucose dehydrogenase
MKMKTIAALLMVLSATFAASTVTEQQLRDAQADAATWLTYGKNYQGWRFSPLAEINTNTVSRLAPRWIYQTSVGGNHETTPLVFGGMMYVTSPSNHAYALDLLTGKPIWHYHKDPPAGLNLCCGQPNWLCGAGRQTFQGECRSDARSPGCAHRRGVVGAADCRLQEGLHCNGRAAGG